MPAVSQSERALLRAVIDAISAGPAVETLAGGVAELVVRATSTDVCFVHVLDDTERSLTLAGATPPFDREVGRVRLALGEGIAGWVALHRRPAVIAEAKHADPRYKPIPELRGRDFTSMASVPMANSQAGLVGVLNVHTRQRRAFGATDVALLARVGGLVAGGLHVARRHRQLAARERAHEQFADQVVAAQEAERRRLVGDLHDGISQRLVSLAYHLDAARHTVASSPDRALEQLREARELADLALDEARSVVSGLLPPVLDDLGLAGGLASVARGLAGVDVRLDLCDTRLPEHVEVALYRIAQEAMQNVVRHADASSLQVTYAYGRGTARLDIADDGVGFDPGRDSPTTEPGSGGYGLASMAERAKIVGGRLTVRSAPGDGTRVTLVVPAPVR
ncbi:MAG: GAF domain-containing protein [Streptosporangiales bacterium]|nr:GAF domain-containing protein [Streptosporangiales bacterium]